MNIHKDSFDVSISLEYNTISQQAAKRRWDMKMSLLCQLYSVHPMCILYC